MRQARATTRRWGQLLGLALLAWGSADVARAAGFVGPESCRACHQAAYDQWKSSPHARAFRSLSAEEQKDAKCLQCHARDQAQGGDAGVTCETCHGAGQYYWPDYVMRDRELAHAAGLATVSAKDPKLCLECHDGTSPAIVPFDPAQKMKEIDHWSTDRAERHAQAGEACPRHRQAVASALPGETFLGRALLSHPAAQEKARPARPGKAQRRRRVHVAAAAGSPAGQQVAVRVAQAE